MIYKLSPLLLHLLLLSGTATAQQKPFTLTGTIQGKTGVYIYLSYPEDEAGTIKRDSTLIKNGQFSFKGAFNGPAVEAFVYMDRKIGWAVNIDKLPGAVLLLLVPGDLQLSLDYHNFRKSVVLKGSPVQAQADSLEQSKSLINAQIALLSDARVKAYAIYRDAVKAKKDEAMVQCLLETEATVKLAETQLEKQMVKMDLAFMDQNPKSFVTASKLRGLLKLMPIKEGLERYSKLPEEIQRSSLGKTIREELGKFGKGAHPGVRAFEFTSMELKGGELKLSDYKGRYVLLDFWASACVPCRKGHPHLLSLYEKYKEKGLEIIGISDDDRNPEAWKKAIEKDGIGGWKHVLYGRTQTAEECKAISDQYGIATVPTKILIDPQGIIVGRYGTYGENHEALDKKLAELFGK